MTLGNMRALGCAALIATCRSCRREVLVEPSQLSDGVFVPEAGRRMRCKRCSARGAETRPAWHTMRRAGMG
jgi:hypothetical protein